MKLETPKNPNYCATVVRLRSIVQLENCDNVVGTPIFGFQAIVSKASQVGDIGIVFPAETRLSQEFCAENNLFRHANFNKNESVKGYIEDNRRVKAIKFRGHRSDCLFMPLSSLDWTGIDTSELKEGDNFDVLNDKLICEKYERPIQVSRAQRTMDKAFRRVDKKFLPEHYDNENYFKNEENIKPDQNIIVTQKLHGTSIRIGNTIVLRKPTLIDRVARFFGATIKESEFDYVFGSRRVIKDVNNPNQIHFYGEDIWTHEGRKLEGIIPQNYVIYAELIGWTPEGAEIQKNYTYQIPEGACELYVYRVAHVNAEGVISDLCWDHVREFCHQRGLKHVPELWRGPKSKFRPKNYIDIRFFDKKRRKWTDSPVPLNDDKNLVDEGVCVRIDTLVPQIYKAKSPIFLQHETKLIDQGADDLEAEGSVPETE